MLQEVESIKEEKLVSHLDEVRGNINEEDSFNIDKTEEFSSNQNFFGLRLLICSILLWSFLFIEKSDYGRIYVTTITQMITEQIEIEPVQEIVNKLTLVIQQMI